LLFALLALAGCAGLPETLSARRVEPGQTPTLNPGEIVIFGRILFIENGKNKAPYGLGKPFWQLESPPNRALSGQTERRLNIPFLSTRKDGVFVYVIPAGRYAMSHVEPFYYMPQIDPALEFDASQPDRSYYLGDLEIDIDTTTWLGGLWGNYITHLNHLEVLDRFEEFRDSPPWAGTSDQLHKALMTRTHGRIPELKSPTAGGLLVAPAGALHR
jgi:hypothetical protein